MYDGTNVTLKTAKTLFIGENGKHLAKYLQRSQPVLMKRANVYNEPPFFDALFAFIKPWMTEKMRDRIKLHGCSMVSVYKDIDMTVLPTEYLLDSYSGPCAGPLQSIIDDMITDMMEPEFRSYIQNLSSGNCGVNLCKRKQDEQPAASFRKLHAE